jgi:hypothetical protein
LIDDLFLKLLKNISWCYGFSKEIGAHNLSINNSRKMFLCSSHIGVVYNFEKNEQTLLQGHVRPF